MKRMLIVARREYLSYVATWGFWISLIMVPVFISAGFILPVVLERSSPERSFAVVADDPRMAGSIDAVLAERLAMGGPGAPGAPEPRDYVRVPAPAEDAAALRPYLTGERLLPSGAPLYAAIIVRRGADGDYELDYWSANLTNPALRSAAAEGAARVMRDDALRDAGIDPQTVREIASARPVVRDFAPGRGDEVRLSDRLPFFLGVGAGFVLWSVIFSVANMLLTSTIEEKSNKVLEVLLSSARLPEILSGKLLGVAGVSLTLLVAWSAAGMAVLLPLAAGGGGPAAEIVAALARPGFVLPFLFYFAAGYLIYGAMFMAIGALCETIQEAQTLMSPLILVMMAPMLLLVFSIGNLDSPLVTGASWFPPATPFLMIARLPQEPPLWEILGTGALMLVTLAVIIWASAAVFRAGALGQARPGSVFKTLRRR